MTDYVKQTAKRSLALSQDAVQSFGWLYPIYGIPYFLQHSELRKPLEKLILPSLAISAVVFGLMFTFTYVPQALALSALQLGPWGFITAFGVVLEESQFIISIVLKAFLFNTTLAETFDNVLLIKGQDELVSKGREISQAKAGQSGKTLGKMVMKPLDKFKPAAIIKYLISIPLNAIPVVGTFVFFALNGVQQGPAQMSRYHQLKQFTPEQKKKFVHEHRGAYTALGVTSLLLTLVPVIGPVVFAYSNQVGAALLAVDLETKKGKVAEGEREIRGGRKKEL
ncbi:hypothetical protein [Phaffia rhodozyma]|uniref:Uncharacterized protein n=1 Tax=Phaffia rhodozyma TaxID=264483 RepID=A0A0F7SSJ4_PHARH|nr:hypothetical protein [Phaffia rhodozyma]